MRYLMAATVLILGVTTVLVAQPSIQWVVHSRYIAGTGASTTLEQPLAFYVQISGLAANQAYSQRHIGLIHSAAPSTTRGSKWGPGKVWISTSTEGPWRTSNASGVIKTWVFVRSPSSFAYIDSTRLRVRIARFGVDTLTFDSPYDIKNVRCDSTADGNASIIYGYMDTTSQNNAGNFMLAYEKASDTRPLACWFIFPEASVIATADSQLYTTRMDNARRWAGYFQLVVPADLKIEKLEVRDTNNVVLRSKTSSLWKSGPKGTMTDLGSLDPLVMSVSERIGTMPSDFTVAQNYPNPFNPVTTIEYGLPREGHVALKVFDLLGQEVGTLVDENQTAGTYRIRFDASSLPSGIYLYQIRAGEFVQSRRMMLVK